jgi:hypothetical protein
MTGATAGWTNAEAASVQEYQESGAFHPYTCGGGGGPCSGVNMRADTAGLHCPICGRLQTWAHDFIVDGTWRAMIPWKY